MLSAPVWRCLGRLAIAMVENRAIVCMRMGRSMVARLIAPQFLVLYAFAASVLAVHYRGKVRLSFGRQLTDHSTVMAPYNALMYLFSAVPNKPVLPVSLVPELATLRENWRLIREEAIAL